MALIYETDLSSGVVPSEFEILKTIYLDPSLTVQDNALLLKTAEIKFKTETFMRKCEIQVDMPDDGINFQVGFAPESGTDGLYIYLNNNTLTVQSYNAHRAVNATIYERNIGSASYSAPVLRKPSTFTFGTYVDRGLRIVYGRLNGATVALTTLHDTTGKVSPRIISKHSNIKINGFRIFDQVTYALPPFKEFDLKLWRFPPEVLHGYPISGVETDENFRPIKDVRIKLIDKYTNELFAETFTDEKGKWTFDKTQLNRSYVILAEKGKDVWMANRAENSDGVLAGVYRIKGSGVANADLKVYSEDSAKFIGRVKTDSTGNFRVEGLERGKQYFIVARDPKGLWEDRVSSRREAV